MGCKLSVEGDPKLRAKSKEIDAELRKSRSAEKSIIKILLLGTGEGGKSTVLKQMKIIHNSGFEEEELKSGSRIVHRLLFKVLDIVAKRVEPSLNESVEQIYFQVVEDACIHLNSDPEPLEPNHFDCFKSLFQIPRIKEEMAKEHGSYLSLKYFLANADRVMVPNYLPTTEDFLRLRLRTTGIVEHLFKVNCEVTKGHKTVMNFKMIDVGGQRTERRKWIHCFENVNAILFVASLAEYDQTLEEDPSMNRMHESLELFEKVYHNPFFTETGFILFLNKTDLFAEKIKVKPLRDCFSDYDGDDEYDKGKDYILNRFKEVSTGSPRKKNKIKTLYHHFTCATDTEQIRYIFSSIAEMIIRSSLEKTNLI